jgi:pre-mRNA 3'-end-processing factor FIP1
MASDHEDEDDDLYGTADTKPDHGQTKDEEDGSSGDEPMDEGADSGDDDDDDDDSESVRDIQVEPRAKLMKL